MNIISITLKSAKAFILEHHRHNKPPVGWKFGVGFENNGILIAQLEAVKLIEFYGKNYYEKRF